MIEGTEAEQTRFGVGPGWGVHDPAPRALVRMRPCGHADHRACFEWIEEARNRDLEAVGLDALAPSLPGPVMAETAIHGHRPLAHADEILVSARTIRLGHIRFEMEYAVWRDGLCALN